VISAEVEMEKAWAKKLEDLNTQHQADLAARDAQLKALQEQLQRYVGLRSRGVKG
jgi:Skp family chaperone for outer membrane proteins